MQQLKRNKRGKTQRGVSGISFLAGLYRAISLAGNNYMASNNTNNPRPNHNRLGLMSHQYIKLSSSRDIQVQRQ